MVTVRLWSQLMTRQAVSVILTEMRVSNSYSDGVRTVESEPKKYYEERRSLESVWVYFSSALQFCERILGHDWLQTVYVQYVERG